MNSKLLLRALRSNKLKLNTHMLKTSRSRGPFEPYSIFPFDSTKEDHEEPNHADYVNELLDDDYFHYFHQDADAIQDISQFEEQRIWYHWYINPKKILEKADFGSPLIRFLYLTFPAFILFFIIFIKPQKAKTFSPCYYPVARHLVI